MTITYTNTDPICQIGPGFQSPYQWPTTGELAQAQITYNPAPELLSLEQRLERVERMLVEILEEIRK